LHQPHGGAEGQAVDIEIQAKEMTRYRKLLEQLIAMHTGRPLEKVAVFAARRDNTLIPIDTDTAGAARRVAVLPSEFRRDGSLAGFKCNRASVSRSGHARGFASSDRPAFAPPSPADHRGP
jgi:ATP-dependent Clp protease protease subunit